MVSSRFVRVFLLIVVSSVTGWTQTMHGNCSDSDLDVILAKIDAADVIRVNPDEHPWIGNQALIDAVTSHSIELAQIVSHHAEHIRRHVGWSSQSRNIVGGDFTRDGIFHVNYEITRNGSTWTFKYLGLSRADPSQPKPAANTIFLPRAHVQAPTGSEPSRLEVDGRHWRLLAGEQELARGAF
jgi:hypothetical protein